MNGAAVELVDLLRRGGWTLGTCESLTGGAVAAAVTDVPGSSMAYRGSLVTYASELKRDLVGLDQAWIDAHGVVNEHTALQMARGARELLRVDWALSLTGVAGPGPQDAVPAGTVWLGLAGPVGERSSVLQLPGDRGQVRQGCVAAALSFVLHWCRVALGDRQDELRQGDVVGLA